jgi:hypothetical protein
VTTSARFGLDHAGERLELSARRAGLRTCATLFRDGDPIRTATGFGRVLLPAAEGIGAVPTVLVLSLLPGTVGRALLLVPRPAAESPSDGSGPDLAGAGGEGSGRDAALATIAEALPPGLGWIATADKHPFAPPPGSLAARLQAFERDHPRLWASRHVVLAVLKVLVALLGFAAFIRLLIAPVLSWLRGLLPAIDLPEIPWPDIDLPDIPWPDIDLPELVLPHWLRVVLGTAKFWVPVLVAIAVAVAEVRRRRTAHTRAGQDDRDADG